MEDSRNQGLSSEQARENFEKYGPNELSFSKKKNLFRQIFGILCEPMFLLLIAAAVIYFILGEARDGAVMLVFVLGVISIDVFQEIKTDKTLEALKELSAPQTEVCRNGVRMMIPSRNSTRRYYIRMRGGKNTRGRSNSLYERSVHRRKHAYGRSRGSMEGTLW